MNNFLVTTDGSFRAHLGDLILKSEKVGDTEGWHFKGTASTSDKDREGETLLQKGLNFEPFIDSGEFNWNHIPQLMVGVPVGKKAWFSDGCWKCEGIILRDMPIIPNVYSTNEVIQQHNQLRKAGLPRGLCLSVEGKVRDRSDCGKYVKKADIFNIAVTFRPVNPSCTLDMLAKSMSGAANLLVDDAFYKSAQSLGLPTAFMQADEEDGEDDELMLGFKLVSHLVRKGYSKADAERHVRSYFRKKFN